MRKWVYRPGLQGLVWLSREKVTSARRNILLLLQPKSVNPYAHLRHGLSHRVDDTHKAIYIYIYKYLQYGYSVAISQANQHLTSGSEITEHATFWLCVKAVVGGKSSFRLKRVTSLWKPRL